MIKFDFINRLKAINMRKVRVSARNLFSSKKKIAVVSVAGVLVLGGGVYAATQLGAKKNSGKNSNATKNSTASQRGNNPADVPSRSKSSNSKSGSQSKQMIATRVERLQRRIDDAVKKKRLTKEQAEKATNKLKELSAAREKVIDKPRAEQIKSLSDTRKALTEWAKQNKIPHSYFSGIL